MPIWRNLSVDTKLLWNQPSRIGRCATLLGYPSMFFVNTLYVGHLIVEFCICILKAMTNYHLKSVIYTKSVSISCNSHLQVLVATIPRSRLIIVGSQFINKINILYGEMEIQPMRSPTLQSLTDAVI